MNVLFIGATGIVGHQVLPLLMEQGFDITAAAIGGGEAAGLPVIDVDITNWESVEKVVAQGTAQGERFDAIVNCAIANYHTWDKKNPEARRDYYERCIDVNARGAYHVYEAAARAEVPCVVFISSMTAVFGPPRYEVIDKHALDRPRDVYAACKVFGEHVGRGYAFPGKDDFALRVSCLRLGMPYPVFTGSDTMWKESAGRRKAMVHMHDIAQAIRLSLESETRFGVYTIVSESDEPYVYPELYSELGYQPEVKFGEGRLSFASEAAEASDVLACQAIAKHNEAKLAAAEVAMPERRTSNGSEGNGVVSKQRAPELVTASAPE